MFGALCHRRDRFKRYAARERVLGFSLFELIITLSVAAILATIAVPSYRLLVQNTGQATQTSELISALNYARSSAVARGTTVALCASADQTQCSGTPDWSRGWIVYAAAQNKTPGQGADVLRVHRALSNGYTLSASDGQPVSFNSSGFALSGTHFTASKASGSPDQVICVATTGRVSIRNTSSC